MQALLRAYNQQQAKPAMKKFFAFILLLSHINSSLFFPLMEQDEINSMVEFVDEKVLNHIDVTPEDKDEQNMSDLFSKSKVSISICALEYYNGSLFQVKIISPAIYEEYIEPRLALVSIELNAPPPDA